LEDSLNCAVSGASSGRGEGRTIKDAPLARETVEQVDDFAGRVKAKRVELAPALPIRRKTDRSNPCFSRPAVPAIHEIIERTHL
jgi:hypothetical protein